MTEVGVQRRLPVGRWILLTGCMLAIGVATAWLYYAMRSVMDVGGTCAEGGPYVIETHCPDGSTLFLTLGLPLWMAGVFIGLVAATISAPQPIFPGWALLFGALGWNFLDYGLHADPSGNVVASWIVCGVMFWLMALPAAVIFVGGRFIGRGQLTDNPGSGFAWVGVYLVTIVVGWWLGVLMYRAWT